MWFVPSGARLLYRSSPSAPRLGRGCFAVGNCGTPVDSVGLSLRSAGAGPLLASACWRAASSRSRAVRAKARRGESTFSRLVGSRIAVTRCQKVKMEFLMK